MTPYTRIYIGEGANAVDISEYVDKVVIEDSIEKDNMVEITAYAEKAELLLDVEGVVENAIMYVQFGLLGTQQSPIHRVKIEDIEPDYGKSVRLTIRGLDTGNAMKKADNNIVWSELTSSQIARKIADKYGLVLETDETTKVWDSIPQGNKSDMEFLRYLAERETDGDYIVYVRSSTLYFVKEKLEQDSKLTYTYAKDDRFIKFSPRYRQSTSDGGTISTALSGVNGRNKTAYSGKAGQDNKKNNVKLGTKSITFSTKTGVSGYGTVLASTPSNKVVPVKGPNVKKKEEEKGIAAKIGDFIESGVDAISNFLSVDAGGEVEAVNRSNRRVKAKEKKVLTATLNIELNVDIEPNSIITIAGVHKKYLGNWFVTELRHTIGNSALTECNLSRNATNTNTTKTSNSTDGVRGTKQDEKINNSVGPNNGTGERKIKFMTQTGVSGYGTVLSNELKPSK